MRKLIVLLTLLLSSIGTFAQYKLVKAADLPDVIKTANKDSIQLLERLIAIEFHKILNQYRKDNKLDTLAWSDILWLTSRNHNAYMIANDELTHNEEKNKPYFTGEKPGDRLNYVQGDKGRMDWSGENCLYTSATTYVMYVNKKSMQEYAKANALECLDIWKSSPGHNANMLRLNHRKHGAAFTFDDNTIYATDLFGYGFYDDNTTSDFDNKQTNSTPNSNSTPIITEPIHKFSPGKSNKELKNGIIAKMKNTNKQIALAKPFEEAAQKHIAYLQANNSLSSTEIKGNKSFYGATPAQRIAKANYGGWKFLHPKLKNISETIALIEMNEDDFDASTVIEELWTQLITNSNIDLSEYNIAGLSVKTKRTKQGIQIHAVLLLHP
ncbi:MAG: CAP domain-containing protein [Bacteroidia bacterium]|jgi:uncharacterized protein YkwD|nr:hypothetical protein [Bacteroidia bacterium]MCO5253985.1 CAP domain-containing protein [Bacteroidota bacterium]MCZ2128654.1 CAP domain-containing protein [Bacteroidia bacterium]